MVLPVAVGSEMVACGGQNRSRKVTGCACCDGGCCFYPRMRWWLGCLSGGEASGDDKVVQGGRNGWHELLNREGEREKSFWFLEREREN